MTILFPLADLYTFKINLMFDKIPSWKQRNDSKQYMGDLDGVRSTPVTVTYRVRLINSKSEIRSCLRQLFYAKYTGLVRNVIKII